MFHASITENKSHHGPPRSNLTAERGQRSFPLEIAHPHVTRLQTVYGNQAVLRMLSRPTAEVTRTSEAALQRKPDERPDAGVTELPKASPPPGKTEKEAPKAEEKMKNCLKPYTVESWEADTCCTNQGFPDPSAKNKDRGDCCNTFPAFVDNEAVKLGFDGAASCRARDWLGHRARVTPSGKSPTIVDVLCVDTRASAEHHVIELGFHAAQKAYGSTHVSDTDAKVCKGDKKEVSTCPLVTSCDDTKNPTESQCLPKGCSKTSPAAGTEKEAPPKK